MKILFVADGRSPTTLSWLRYWLAQGHAVHLVSTFRCTPPAGLASFHLLPVAFNRMAGGGGSGSARRDLISRMRDPLRIARYLLGPLSLPVPQLRFRRILKRVQPDLVHALRIPFEGMLAAVTPRGMPLVISIWGNDLTLHAGGSGLMRRLTRQVLRRADGLMADTERDLHLAVEWGFHGPNLVVPGGGGIERQAIKSAEAALPFELPKGAIVVNPRGHRPGSLRQDVFFRAIPQVLAAVPTVFFLCPPLNGDPIAEAWVKDLGIRANVRLLPRLTQAQLWTLYRQAQVFVSPSVHDGTPNSLLEAMACGCFPVVGDIASMREWITPEVNGLLVDAASEASIAQALIRALQDPDLRERAEKENARRIAERAEVGHAMANVQAFYEKLIRG